MKPIALVTGGSRGIGAAIAAGLARDGYLAAVNYANDSKAAGAVVETIEAFGGEAFAIQADISLETDVGRLFAAIDAVAGARLSVLVNNGGVTGGFKRVEDIDHATLAQVFGVNVFGAFLCSREAVRRMSKRHGGAGGSIVNLSSRAGELGGGGEWVHYAATKGALDTLTAGLAREVAQDGIRVNGVAAGLIETRLHADAGDPTRTNRLAPAIPMGRAGTPEEVAEAVRWLVSGAEYVTGATVAVSGGR